MVLGITAAHLLAHLGVAAGPEAGQVTGELDGAARRAEQLHQERHLASGNARGLPGAQHLLQGHGEEGDVAGQIIDGAPGAGGGDQVGGGLLVQALALMPVEAGGEDGGQVQVPDVGEAALARQPGAQPVGQVRGQPRVGQVRPAGLRFQPAQQRDPGLKLTGLRAPGQGLVGILADPRQQQCLNRIAG